MSSLVKLFRVVGAATLALGVWGATVVDKAPVARAAGFETLMVPSAAMGRDIPVAFQGGGPHAVDVSQSASDAVYSGGITSLPLLLKVARRTKRVMIQNFSFAAAYNLIAIPIAISGHATPLVAAIAMSLSSMAVSLNAIRLAGINKGA